MRAANDGLRFLLELAVLVAVAYWGYRATSSPVRWLLVIAGPVVLGTVWAIWVAAKSSSALREPWRLLLEIAVFGAGVVALAWAGRSTFAVGLATVSIVHLALTFAFDQRSSASSRSDRSALVATPPGREA